MLPLRDDIPSRSFPIVTVTIIAVNVIVFLWEVALGDELDPMIRELAVVPARLEPLDLVTSMFLHGGWWHLFGNMLYLWIFGDNVEDRFGRLRFLAFYFVAGVVAGLAHVVTHLDSTAPTVGASGAVAGVLGAYALMYPRARVLAVVPIVFIPWFVELPAIAYLGLWFLVQLGSGVADLSATADQAAGVAWWAHAGGFAVGFALCPLLRRREPPPKRMTGPPVEWIRH